MQLDTNRLIIGSNAERTRGHNRKAVLGLVKHHQPVGRAELARLSGLSTQAVSNIISELERAGYLHETGRKVKGRGLPSIQYCLKSDGGYGLGIEIRPNAMFAALTNLAGESCYSKRVSISDCTPQSTRDIATTLMQEALSDTGIEHGQLLGAGIVLPGPFGDVGLSGVGDTTLTGWDDTNPKKMFADALNLPVIVENDATAAALAENVGGIAKFLHSYCYIYFGTGLGLGIVVDGKAVRGANGNAGELGHIVVHPGGKKCACGNFGCLETYVSRLSVKAHMAKSGITIGNVDDLQDQFEEKHPDLLTWLSSAVKPLALGVGMIENLFDPQTIIIGGAMPDPILEYLINSISLTDASIAKTKHRAIPRLQKGSSGRMTAAYGGAALIVHNAFTPGFAPNN